MKHILSEDELFVVLGILSEARGKITNGTLVVRGADGTLDRLDSAIDKLSHLYESRPPETVLKDSTLQTIFDNCHAVSINMNDTFYYACADSACIEKMELDDLEPVIEKYGYRAFTAYEALKRGHDPCIPQVASHPDFKAAKALIESMMGTAEEFGVFFELHRVIKDLKPHKPEERKRISKSTSKLKDWFTFFSSR